MTTKGQVTPHRIVSKIDRPFDLKVTLSHAERLQLWRLSDRLGLNYSAVVRLAIKTLALTPTTTHAEE